VRIRTVVQRENVTICQREGTLRTARCIANQALYKARIERLDEIKIDADLLRLGTVILARHAGHGDDEKLLEARVTSKSLRNLETINARHCEVEEEHVGLHAAGDAYGRDPVMG
jgi:hypothetical protein